MALDTSMLTSEIHARVKAGESIGEIARSFGSDSNGDPLVPPVVIRQYLEKIDDEGRSRESLADALERHPDEITHREVKAAEALARAHATTVGEEPLL